jgi:hypothetical protein
MVSTFVNWVGTSGHRDRNNRLGRRQKLQDSRIDATTFYNGFIMVTLGGGGLLGVFRRMIGTQDHSIAYTDGVWILFFFCLA